MFLEDFTSPFVKETTPACLQPTSCPCKLTRDLHVELVTVIGGEFGVDHLKAVCACAGLDCDSAGRQAAAHGGSGGDAHTAASSRARQVQLRHLHLNPPNQAVVVSAAENQWRELKIAEERKLNWTK